MAQERFRRDLAAAPHQAGINYQAGKYTLLTLGYAYVRTHPYGRYPINRGFPEHRIHQQAWSGTPLVRSGYRIASVWSSGLSLAWLMVTLGQRGWTPGDI